MTPFRNSSERLLTINKVMLRVLTVANITEWPHTRRYGRKPNTSRYSWLERFPQFVMVSEDSEGGVITAKVYPKAGTRKPTLIITCQRDQLVPSIVYIDGESSL